MNNKIIIDIAGKNVERIEYNGQPVVTFRMVDDLHDRQEAIASYTFMQNKERFVKNEDYFEVDFQDWPDISGGHEIFVRKGEPLNNIVLLTESGYLMVSKPYDSERDWDVRREIVRNYFVAKEILITKETIDSVKFFLKDAVPLFDLLSVELANIRDELTCVGQEQSYFRDKLIALCNHLDPEGVSCILDKNTIHVHVHVYNKNIISIMDKDIECFEYKGEPVLTFKVVDDLHDRAKGTAESLFYEIGAEQLLEGEDYFNVPSKHKYQTPMIFLTESGYLRITNLFDEEFDWKIRRALLTNYFVPGENSHIITPDSQTLMKDAIHLLDIVCNELDRIQDKKEKLRNRLLSLQDRLSTKNGGRSETMSRQSQTTPSVKDEKDEKDGNGERDEKSEILIRFVMAWWKEFSGDNVGVSHLYPMISKYDIPLKLSGTTERSRRVSLGKILTEICGQQLGDYIVTAGEPFRNVKRYKLQIGPVV